MPSTAGHTSSIPQTRASDTMMVATCYWNVPLECTTGMYRARAMRPCRIDLPSRFQVLHLHVHQPSQGTPQSTLTTDATADIHTLYCWMDCLPPTSVHSSGVLAVMRREWNGKLLPACMQWCECVRVRTGMQLCASGVGWCKNGHAALRTVSRHRCMVII